MSDTTVVAGKYRIVRHLATGGMGEVSLAAQVGPAGYQRLVALKHIAPSLAADQEALELFLDEARLVALLNHRNIVQTIELGEENGGYFVAMEFVKGTSTRALLDKLRDTGERLEPAHAVEIAAQVAEALAYAYTAPGADGEPLHIIHRDVTPHNVLLSTSGDVKLIDFGVAKSAQQEHATQSGMVKGKLAYLSPEQSRGQPLDARSDLFSLGILLYEMVTGTNPFVRGQTYAQLRAIQTANPPALGTMSGAWAPLDEVVARLLAKEKEERYADASEAAEALLDLLHALPRPVQRLGALVAERSGGDLSSLSSSITDSKIRAALAITGAKMAAAPPGPPPPRAAPRPQPEPEPTFIRPVRASTPVESGATLMKQPVIAVQEHEDDEEPVEVEETQRLHALLANRRPAATGHRSSWMAVGAISLVAVAGAVYATVGMLP